MLTSIQGIACSQIKTILITMKIPSSFYLFINLPKHLHDLGYESIKGFNEKTIEAYKNNELFLFQKEPNEYSLNFYEYKKGKIRFVEYQSFVNQLIVYAQVYNNFRYFSFRERNVSIISPLQLYNYYLDR